MRGFVDWNNVWTLLAIWLVMGWVGRPLMGRWLRVILDRVQEHSERSKREKEQRAKTIVHVVTTTTMVGLTALLIFVGLSELGFDIGPLIAGAGIVGFAMGFGSQNLVRDVINGLFILLEDQFGEGDVVEIGGAKGKVEEFNLRRTVLRDEEGVAHHIPNSQIGRVANFTQRWALVMVNVKVGMNEKADKVKRILLKVAKQVADQEDPSKTREPWVTLEEVGGGSMNFRIKFEVEGGAQWRVRRELLIRMKTALEKAKIEMK